MLTQDIRGTELSIDQLIGLNNQAKQLKLMPFHRVFGSKTGEHKTAIRGRGLDFEEVRLYAPGDELRSIDWRVSARSSHVYSKVYREERESTTVVITDLRTPMYFASRGALKSIKAIELSSLIAWSCINQKESLVCGTLTDLGLTTLRKCGNKKSLLRQFKQLADMSSHPTTHKTEINNASRAKNWMSDTIAQLARFTHAGATIFFIGDFLNTPPTEVQKLKKIARYNSIILLQINDPLEQQLPFDTGLAFQASNILEPVGSTESSQQLESAETFILDGNNKMLRKEFEQSFLKQTADLQQSLRQMRGMFHQLQTDSNSFEFLQKLARNKNRR